VGWVLQATVLPERRAKMKTRLALAVILAFTFTLGLLLFARSTSQAGTNAVRCVNTTGSGGCFTSIQAAINAANPGDILQVDSGTYHEHITVTKNLEIYGKGWVSTTIDGGYSQARATVDIPSNIDASTIISGFKITGGGDGHADDVDQEGGGIYIYIGSPRIINTWVYSCTASNGGGVWVGGGSPYFQNVPVWNNRAAQKGGGFYIVGYADIDMEGDLNFLSTNGTIYDNYAEDEGGGIYIGSMVTATIHKMQIISNTANHNGGGGITISYDSDHVSLVDNWIGEHPLSVIFPDLFPWKGNQALISGGGGLSAYESSNLEIRNNWIVKNTTPFEGGGIKFYRSQGVIKNNQILGNSATAPYGNGGGIYIWGDTSDVSINNNWIEGNFGYAPAGGIEVQDGEVEIDANAIISNSIDSGIGVGIHIFSATNAIVTNNIVAGNYISSAYGKGSGIAIAGCPAEIINNTIAQNHHGGLYFVDAEGIEIIINNIIASNSGTGIEREIYSAESSYLEDYNNVFNNPYVNLGMGGGHDYSVDPQFVGSGDYAAYHHIMNSSPVSVTGSVSYAPPFDYDGQPRFLGGSVSMGADEIVPVQYDLFLPLVLKNYP
jgi:hypothetical protein